MPGKRKHEETEEKEVVHPSRQFQVPGSKPKLSKRPRNSEPPVHKKQAHASSVNVIKKRMRDVSRRLERAGDLPANVKLEDERALAAYEQELAAAEAEKIRQKMIKKYHMVRFFERQKATRQLKKLRKRLLESKSEEEVQALNEQMHIAEVDLNYTQYCPLSEIYISLYPVQKKHGAEGDDTPAPSKSGAKPPLWAEVEKCMEEGTLSKLRNRINTATIQKPKPLEARPSKPKRKTKLIIQPDTSGLNRRERRRKQHGDQDDGRKKNKSLGFEKNEIFGASQVAQWKEAEDGDDSDGGFFED
ncbi:hypothetical protein BJ875DRAFT_18637 [Amylocarpus encephaloides]|uniref:rRNA-processing protein EFG1 n=1 Tax=Amylocarpus encephaloides TaxID=45428 RepID=A0A9P7YI42_9HELO|nr:hypothetical protein BJ875DRAFT_18637 [Amylocarpus encephaloides]